MQPFIWEQEAASSLIRKLKDMKAVSTIWEKKNTPILLFSEL